MKSEKDKDMERQIEFAKAKAKILEGLTAFKDMYRLKEQKRQLNKMCFGYAKGKPKEEEVRFLEESVKRSEKY